MRQALVVATAALAASAAGAGEPSEFVKGPYLQDVTRTAVTFMWQSEAPCAGTIRVGTGPGGPLEAAAPAATLHEVRVDGLRPGRRYAYTIECGGRTAGGELATAAEASEPFSFVVFGDTRENTEQHRAVVERVRREVPDFILMTGDMVDDGGSEKDWATFFAVEREFLAENVLFPAVGNHDWHGRTRGADAYRRYFSLPADAPDPERYYGVTYGNTRVLVLDSNEYSFALTDQTAWLERELHLAATDPAIAHRFIVMHHPPYSTSLHGGQAELREMWTPLFERYGVDAVFSGHDHVYERSEKNGVRYFVTGGGGAPLYPRDPRPRPEDLAASRYFERTLNYLRVHVVGGFVEVAALRQDGTLIENVSWGALPQRLVASATPARAGAPVASVHVASAVPEASGGCAVAGGQDGAAGALAAWAGIVLVRRRARSAGGRPGVCYACRRNRRSES